MKHRFKTKFVIYTAKTAAFLKTKKTVTFLVFVQIFSIYQIVGNIMNKNIIMSSFKSSRDTQKEEGGPDSCFG